MQVDEIVVPVRAKADGSDLDNLEKKAKKSTNALTEIFKNWSDGIKKLFRDAFDFSGYFKRIAAKLSGLIDFDFILTGIQKIKSAIGTVTSNIMDGFYSVAKGLKGIIKSAQDMLKDAGKLIGKQLATNLRYSLKQVVTWFKKNQKTIKKQLSQIARSVGHLLSSFASGLIQIVRMGKTFVDWFNNLPKAIQGATYAVLALWAVLKGGPIGVLSTIVTMIGAIADDYKQYKLNKETGSTYGIAFPGIWQLIYNDDKQGKQTEAQVNAGQRVKQIAKKIIQKVLTSITQWINDNKETIFSIGQEIFGAIADAIQFASNLIAGGTDGQNKSIYESFSLTVGDFIGGLIDVGISGIGDIGGSIVSFIATCLTGKSTDQWTTQLKTQVRDNAFAQAIGTYLQAAVLGLSPSWSLAAAVITFLYKSFKGNNADQGLSFDFSDQFGDIALVIAQSLVGALKIVHVTSQMITEAVATLIENIFSGWKTSSGTTDYTFSPDAIDGFSNIVDGLILGAIGSIAGGGNVYITIASAIFGLFSDAFTNAFSTAQKDLWTGQIDWKVFFEQLGLNSQQTIKDIGAAVSGLLDLAIKGLKIASDVQQDIVFAIYNVIAGAFGLDKLKPEEMDPAHKSAIQAGFNAILVGAFTGNVGTGLFSGLVTAIFNSFTQALGDRKIEDLSSDEWGEILGLTGGNLLQIGKVFLNTITKAFQAVQEWWNSPETKDQVEKLKNEWDNIWNGDQDFEGLSTIFGNVWQTVSDGFVTMIKGLWGLVSDDVALLAANIGLAIWNALPDSVKSFLGWQAPTVVSTNSANGTLTFNRGGESPITMSDQTDGSGNTLSDFYKNHGQNLNVSLDENGNPVTTVRINNGTPQGSADSATQQRLNAQIQKALASGDIGRADELMTKAKKFYNGRDWSDGLSDTGRILFGNNTEGYDYLFNSSPVNQNGFGGGGRHFGQPDGKTSKADKESTENMAQTATNTQSTAKTTGQIKSGLATLNLLLKQVVDNTASGGGSGGGDGDDGGVPDKPSDSYGGRISSPGRHLIGQDGTQYVIPISNTNRAVQLIQDMVVQMGGKAKDAVANALGITRNASTIGGSMLTGSGIMGQAGGVNIVYNNNVSAPVTINVTSNGTSAQSVGMQVYSSAEKALLRTLRAAVG